MVLYIYNIYYIYANGVKSTISENHGHETKNTFIRTP